MQSYLSAVTYFVQLSVELYYCQYQCQSIRKSEIINAAKIAELLQSPRRRSKVTVLYQEMTDEQEMFLDVDGRQTEKKMIGCQMARSSILMMQRLEMYVGRRLLAGMVAQAVGVTMMGEATRTS